MAFFYSLTTTALLLKYRTGFHPVLLIMIHLQAKKTVYIAVTAIGEVSQGPQNLKNRQK